MAIQVSEQSFDALMHELEESAMGKQLWRHFQWLRRYWLPIKSGELFDDDTEMGEAERARLEDAITKQIASNFDLLRYMCWRTTSAPVLENAKLPVRIGEFAKQVLGRKDTTAIRGWRQRYAGLEAYLSMCGKTGHDILNAVQDDHFVEIAEQAMNRENDKQVQWMKLATEIRGDKQPDEVIVDWRDTLPKRNADK